jgi:hypothetical protein
MWATIDWNSTDSLPVYWSWLLYLHLHLFLVTHMILETWRCFLLLLPISLDYTNGFKKQTWFCNSIHSMNDVIWLVIRILIFFALDVDLLSWRKIFLFSALSNANRNCVQSSKSISKSNTKKQKKIIGIEFIMISTGAMILHFLFKSFFFADCRYSSFVFFMS